MEESEFHHLADRELSVLADALEEADAEGALDLESQAGIITITLADKRQYVISKHTPSRQIWLSSPLSGGLHFGYDAAREHWALADGRTLPGILTQELKVKL